MKLGEIAAKIDDYLRHFEYDPEINRKNQYNASRFFMAKAFKSGNRIMVTYVGYQGPCSLKKSEAERYLLWLKDGNVGKHFDMDRLSTAASSSGEEQKGEK